MENINAKLLETSGSEGDVVLRKKYLQLTKKGHNSSH